MFYTWICIMAATIAVNTIFVATLLAPLTWEQRAMFLFAAIALAGGLLFTVRTMQRLNKPN
jgi:hypothetical protein